MRVFRDGIHDTIYGERISENMYMDNNGQLICENVVLARTGYYDYLESELIEGGSSQKVVKVYRSPEEVFNPVSMRSMNFKPLTDNHPSDNVTPDTVGSLQKGFMTNIRRGTGEFDGCLMADIVVTDPYVIDEIRSGRKRDLSVGYTADIEEENGQYVMKNIRGNHIALVDAGRAGNARIRDSKPVMDFEAKGSFNSLSELKKFYPGATIDENGDKSVQVRLSNGTRLLYSYVQGTEKLFFVRKADPLRDSVEVLGDALKFRVGQRINYFGNECVVSEISPNMQTGDFLIELNGNGSKWRVSYSELVESVNKGDVKVLDSVVYDSATGKFSLKSIQDFSDCLTDNYAGCFVDKAPQSVQDSDENLKLFRVSVGDRKFVTRATSFDDAARKVRKCMDAPSDSFRFAGKVIPKARGDYYWMEFGGDGILQYHPKDGTGQITTSHPYDETDYHWAHSRDGRQWTIRLEGRQVGSFAGDADAVLRELHRRDKEKGLSRRGGIY